MKNLFLFVSRNCNLLHHDDKPLDGYLSAPCCPLLLIKWYGFDPKTKNKRKRVGASKKRQECVNAPGKPGKRQGRQNKIIHFGYFQHLSILFPMSSTFLVLFLMSPITP
jgi:hypothetical protein